MSFVWESPYEDEGLIPGLAQRVKDQIPRCCGWHGPAAAAPTPPPAWESPYATVPPQKGKKKMPFAVCMKSKSHQGSCILSSDPPPRGGPRPPLQPGVLLGTCQTLLASGDAWAALPSSGSSSSRRRGTEWGVRGLEPSLGAGWGVRRGMSPESGSQPPVAQGELSSDAHSGQSWPASQVWALAGAHTVAVLERRYLHVSGCAVFGGFSHSENIL